MNNRPQRTTWVSASFSGQSGTTGSDALLVEHHDASENSGQTNSAHAEFEALLERAWRVQQGRAALHSAAAWRDGRGSRKRAASRGNS